MAEKAATTVRSAARRPRHRVREQAKPIVEKAHGKVEKTADRVRTTLAATKPVIDRARAVVGRGVGRGRGGAPSEPAQDTPHPATTAPAASEHELPVGGAPREPLPAREAPGSVRLVTRLGERLVPVPATAATAPPADGGRSTAAPRAGGHGLSEQAAPREARSTGLPADSARLASPGDPGPSDATQRTPDGGLSSMSVMLGAAAATIAAFWLTAPSLLRRLRFSPALLRPVAYVSLLERPG